MMASPADFSTDATASNHLSNAEVEDLRDAFRLFDTKNTGKVDVKELQDVISEMLDEESSRGEHATSLRRNMERLYKATKSLPSRIQLNEDDFIRLISAADSDDTRSDLQRVFDLFSGGKDFISLKDLSKVADELGEDMTKEELEEMIERAAPEGGSVTIKEFSAIMDKKLFS